MARRVQVHLVDDLDGGQADETVTFGLDGVVYEIDLSSAHAAELRDALSVYIGAGRRAGRGLTVSANRSRRGGGAAPSRNDRAQNKAIRDWAKRKKINLNERGRIPQRIVDQYQAEAGR